MLNLEPQVELTEPSARLHQYPDSHSPCSVLHALHPVLSATPLDELPIVHKPDLKMVVRKVSCIARTRPAIDPRLYSTRGTKLHSSVHPSSVEQTFQLAVSSVSGSVWPVSSMVAKWLV